MRQDDDTVSQPKACFHTRSHKKALYSTTAWYQTGLRGLGCLSMHSQVQAAHYVKSDDVDKDMIKIYIYMWLFDIERCIRWMHLRTNLQVGCKKSEKSSLT